MKLSHVSLARHVLLGFLVSWASFAHAAEDVDRPRIGLVLGGGGARGAAHIGVLQELERHRVPIDAIAGTSMGAIIGGLYASGMSAEDLEQLVASLDWAEALSDQPPRRDLSFRRKQDDAHFPINLELGVRDGELLLPMGAIEGQKLDLILRELTIGVSKIRDFDELPIPFRAVASDIVRGELRVIGEGDLARAIRASMSVPGIFSPVRMGERLLVDGGLVGNLPIEVMRDMDVDVIIAVDVEFPLYKAGDLDSALAISEQMLTILIRKETLRQIDKLGARDILIRPALGTFGSTDFGKITEAIEPGKRAAEAVAERLRPLGLDRQAFADLRARQTAQTPPDEPLAFVRVMHDGRIKASTLESRLETRSGDPVDTGRLANDADRLYGLDLYEQVSYAMVEGEQGTGVEFRARTKSWGPDTLQFSMSLEDDFEGSTGFNVAARLTRTGLNPSGGEWRTDLQLGNDPRLFSEFYQPFGNESRLFLAPHIDLRQTNFHAFVMDNRVARLRLGKAEGGIDFGYEIENWGEFRLGAYRGTGNARVKVGDPGIPDIDFNTGGVFAQLRIDTFDDAQFPRRGFWTGVRWTQSMPGLGAEDRFDAIEAEVAGTWSRGSSSWQLGLSYASTVNGDAPIQNFFPLGGFLRLSGLERGELSGRHSALGRLVFYRRVGTSAAGLLDLPLYLGASLEAGNVWQLRSEVGFDELHVNGSLFVGMDSFVGPVYLAAGFAEGGRTNFYLFIGSPPR